MLDTFKKATPDSLEAIREEMRVRKTEEIFLLFAMGSQTDHLIFQQVAKLGVYCLVADPATVTAADVRTLNPKGLIISGGPASVESEPPPFDDQILMLGIPVLGICLGFQMWAKFIGLTVSSGRKQFSTHDCVVQPHSLFDGVPERMPVLQSHGDEISEAVEIRSDGFRPLAHCDSVIAAGEFRGDGLHLVGVQFHPEVTETLYGPKIFENFCFGICKAADRYPVVEVAARKITEIRKTVGSKKVLLFLSGGSDSSICAFLLKEAGLMADQVHAIYIKGIDRPDDEEFVHKYFANQPWLRLEIIDATDAFLAVLKGHTKMKAKRLAMREVYKGIGESKVAEIGADLICQGTIYTDVSESGGGHDSGARKATIKIHHNTNLGFSVPELLPLIDCVKDTGRDIGREIGVPEELLIRHPFPGPGQVVRGEGEITKEKLAITRASDGIWIETLRTHGWYEKVWQAGATVTQSEHTYSAGDDAGSGPVIALWAVWSVNGFTARAAEIPYDVIKEAARRIGNEVPGVGAVVYRVSDKPRSTIEWG